MKAATILAAVAIATVAPFLPSCVSSTTTAPDGTVTKTSSFATADEIKAAADAAAEVEAAKRGDVTRTVNQ
jgi:ABC-type glycerol-3-phosphate transport system substrate-binding protein